MPKIKAPKRGKFRLKYTRPNGSSAEVSGEIAERGALMLDMIVTAFTVGPEKLPGLSEVLDRYASDCEERRAAYAADHKPIEAES